MVRLVFDQVEKIYKLRRIPLGMSLLLTLLPMKQLYVLITEIQSLQAV